MHISIIKGIRLGSTNLQTHKDQREIKACLHIQNTKQITIINVFNKLAADASLGLQICGPKPDSFYNGNVHYKMEGVSSFVYMQCHEVVQPSLMHGAAQVAFSLRRALKDLSDVALVAGM